jgi:hypothetical protein
MLDNKNIIIGQGIGELRFGIDRDAVRDILGEPDEVEQYTDEEDEDNLTETWHYDEDEISVSFDEMVGWKLVTIAVSGIEYKFEGLELIGLHSEAVLRRIEKLELGEQLVEEFPVEEGIKQTLITLDEVGVNFWFEDDILSEIIWGPIWDEDILN